MAHPSTETVNPDGNGAHKMHMDLKSTLAIKCRGEKQIHTAQRQLSNGANVFLLP